MRISSWMLALWSYSKHFKLSSPMATHPIQPENILGSLKRTLLIRQVSGYWMLIQKKIHVCAGWKTVIGLFLSRSRAGEFSIAAQFCDMCWQDNCIFEPANLCQYSLKKEYWWGKGVCNSWIWLALRGYREVNQWKTKQPEEVAYNTTICIPFILTWMRLSGRHCKALADRIHCKWLKLD